jgi:hypothetical protein
MIRAVNEPWHVRELLPVRDHHDERCHVELSRLLGRTCSTSVAILDALHRASWWLSLYTVAVA